MVNSRTLKSFVSVVLVGGVLVGCSGESVSVGAETASSPMGRGGEMAMDESAQALSEATASSVSVPADSEQVALLMKNRFVIRNGRMTVRVDGVEKAEVAAQSMVRGFGGFVSAATTSGLGTSSPQMNLTARVPVAKFDSAMSEFAGLGVLVEKSVSSDDVTGQVVDIDARLKVLRIKEEQLYQMLKKTKKLSDMDSVQERLFTVRTQIEQIVSQRKSLAGQAQFSTLDLTLVQNATGGVAPGKSDWNQMAWAESGSAFQGLAAGLGTLGIWVLAFVPFWLPAVLILIGFVIWSRRLGSKRGSVGG